MLGTKILQKGCLILLGQCCAQVVRAVVVAQLVEQSLQTPEIRCSNPHISKILSTNGTIETMKIKRGWE